MTIDEAIKVNTDLYKRIPNHLTLKELDAQKLGIEALKRVKSERQPGTVADRTLLPGETKE